MLDTGPSPEFLSRVVVESRDDDNVGQKFRVPETFLSAVAVSHADSGNLGR